MTRSQQGAFSGALDALALGLLLASVTLGVSGCEYDDPTVDPRLRFATHAPAENVPTYREFYRELNRCHEYRSFAYERAISVRDWSRALSVVLQILAALGGLVSVVVAGVFWRDTQKPSLERWLAVGAGAVAFLSSLVAVLGGLGGAPEPLEQAARALEEPLLHATQVHYELSDAEPDHDRRALRARAREGIDRLRSCASALQDIRANAGDGDTALLDRQIDALIRRRYPDADPPARAERDPANGSALPDPNRALAESDLR
jgi:hypothetical protein